MTRPRTVSTARRHSSACSIPEIMDYKKRTAKVREYLDRHGIPALLLRNPSNIFYLTGLLEIEGFLVLDGKNMTFFVPEMYCSECGDVRWRNKDVDVQTYKPDVLRKFLGRYKRAAFVESEFAYSSVNTLCKKCNLRFRPVPDFIKDMRMLKDQDETELIRKALAINRKVLKKIEKSLVPSRTETGIAGEIHYLIRKYGGRREAFEPVVASGVNSSYPHHKSRNIRIKSGQPLVVDAGVDYCGYKSDLTYTFFPGGRPVDRRFARIYGILEEVLEKTKDFIRPGLTGKEVHGHACGILKERGMEKYFIHGLGHGVGIDVHEKPVLNSASKDVLRKGCVFTIEPGIYIPRLGGIRLEDMVLLQ